MKPTRKKERKVNAFVSLSADNKIKGITDKYPQMAVWRRKITPASTSGLWKIVPCTIIYKLPARTRAQKHEEQ